jgi:GH25 family lysozyme M1 (1,4-beta-N-acetylmuramidase)
MSSIFSNIWSTLTNIFNNTATTISTQISIPTTSSSAPSTTYPTTQAAAQLIQGYDVSSVQGNINYSTLSSNIRFIIAKCGNGNDGIDGLYNANRINAKNSGLCFACYHFVYPLPPLAGDASRSPIAQAQAHFAASGGEIACVDLEWPEPQNWQTWGCSASQIIQWVESYMTEYTSLSGKTPLLYSYPSFMQSLGEPQAFSQYQLWIASWQSSPTIPSPWASVGYTIWQNTGGGGKLPNGVVVDTDVVKDLSLWGIQSANPPVIVPSAPVITPPVPVIISSTSTLTVIQIQENLNLLDAQPQLSVDGILGTETTSAIVKFQQANPPLTVDGVAGALTCAALVSDVSQIQQSLNSLSVSPQLIVDGIAGIETQIAVKNFQQAHPPLVIDGIVGLQTKSLLKSLTGSV